MKNYCPIALFLGFAALSLSAHAQTDVTSQYLKNADFEGDYSIQTEYFKDKTSNHRAVYQLADLEMTYNNDDQYDFSVLKEGDLQYSSLTSVKNLAGLDVTKFGVQTYRLRFRWGLKESVDLYQSVTLPAGAYQLSADVYGNGSGSGKMYIYAGTTKSTENVMSGEWKSVSILFRSDGVKAIDLGIAFPRSKDEQINGVDNFELFSVIDRSSLTEAITAAMTSNKTLNNTDLSEVIAKAQAVVDNAGVTQEEVDT